MTEPEKVPGDRTTAEQPVVAPSVSTAPDRARWHFSRIPSHLGRARTSTLVLSLLFVAIYVLYLNVKPPTQASVPATTETGIEQPVPVPAPTTTAPAPETTAEPTTTAPRTTRAPTSTAEPTTDEPTVEPTPEQTEETTVPTSSPPSSRPTSPTSPTVVSPPG